MATTITTWSQMSLVYTVVLLVSLPTSTTGWNWPWAPDKPTATTTTATPYHKVNISGCPLRPCYVNVNKDINCAHSGCTEINLSLPSDVKGLLFQGNVIASVPRLPYGNLTELDLSNNQIAKIEDTAFQELEHLRVLYLSKNRIRELKSVYFHTLSNLQYLHIDQNQLRDIPLDIFFPFMMSLKKLDLSHNFISNIEPSALSDISSLLHLHLEHNNISSIGRKQLTQLPRLETLYLSSNNIADLEPYTFADLTSLRELDLSFNRIKTLKNDTFALDGSFFENQITRLLLSNNHIENIHPGAFNNLVNLQYLEMSYNHIKTFPPNTLPQNLLGISLTHMTKLEVIEPHAFAGMSKLQHVEISHNRKLWKIAEKAFDVKFHSLKLLDLSLNNLETMSEQVLEDWHNIEETDLSGNPWTCDCHITWMLGVYMRPADRGVISCGSPSHLQGTLLTKVPQDELVCGTMSRFFGPKRSRLGLGLLVFSTLIFLTGGLAFIFKCRHKVFPCRGDGGSTSKYKALYNQAGGDEEEEIQFRKTIDVSETEKRMLQAQAKGDLPEPVAL